MFLVGLTGGIATGKSLVASLLRTMGVEIIDADIVAREVVQPGRRAWFKIRKEFGDSVINRDGTLNRTALGQIVFNQVEKRKILNAITHPEIYKSIMLRCLRLFISGHQFAVVDLPLLYESGKMVKFMHKVIVVTCKKSQQLERLMKRDSLSEIDALSRVNAQMNLEEKCKLGDYIVDNSKDESYTSDQVEAIVKELRQSNVHWIYRLSFAICTVLCLNVVGLVLYALYEFLRTFW